jgi:hypothetical protein
MPRNNHTSWILVLFGLVAALFLLDNVDVTNTGAFVYGTIDVIVKDVNDNPVEGIAVSLVYSGSGSVRSTLTTDSNGRVAFGTNMPKWGYLVKINSPFYAPASSPAFTNDFTSRSFPLTLEDHPPGFYRDLVVEVVDPSGNPIAVLDPPTTRFRGEAVMPLKSSDGNVFTYFMQNKDGEILVFAHSKKQGVRNPPTIPYLFTNDYMDIARQDSDFSPLYITKVGSPSYTLQRDFGRIQQTGPDEGWTNVLLVSPGLPSVASKLYKPIHVSPAVYTYTATHEYTSNTPMPERLVEKIRGEGTIDFTTQQPGDLTIIELKSYARTLLGYSDEEKNEYPFLRTINVHLEEDGPLQYNFDLDVHSKEVLIEPGTYALTATMEGFEPVVKEIVVERLPNTLLSEATIDARPTQKKVEVLATFGKPREGATVKIYESVSGNKGAEIATEETDISGHATFLIPYDGAQEIIVEASALGDTSPEVKVETFANEEVVVANIHPPREVTVNTFGPKGPVEALVAVLNNKVRLTEFHSNGQVVLPEKELTFTTQVDGYNPFKETLNLATFDDTINFDLTTQQVDYTVTGVGGRVGEENVEVVITEDGQTIAAGVTDKEGQFSTPVIPSILPITLIASFTKTGFVTKDIDFSLIEGDTISTQIPLELKQSQEEQIGDGFDLDFDSDIADVGDLGDGVEFESLTVQVTVKDDFGDAVENAKIKALLGEDIVGETTTGSNGEATLELLKGFYTIKVDQEVTEPYSKVLLVSEEPLVIPIVKEKVRINLAPTAEEEIVDANIKVTFNGHNIEGETTFNMPLGTNKVVVTKKDYDGFTGTFNIDKTQQDATKKLTIVPHKGTLELNIVDKSDTKITNGFITLTHQATKEETTTDTNTDLKVGTYDIVIEDESNIYITQEDTLEISKDGTVQKKYTLELKPSKLITNIVFDHNDENVPVGRILVDDEEFSFVDGEYVIPEIPSGTHTIKVTGKMFKETSETVKLTPGDTTQHTFQVKSKVGNIAIHVTNKENQQRLAQATILLLQGDDVMATTNTDDEGQALLTHIVEGTYTISIEKEGAIEETGEIEVKATKTTEVSHTFTTLNTREQNRAAINALNSRIPGLEGRLEHLDESFTNIFKDNKATDAQQASARLQIQETNEQLEAFKEELENFKLESAKAELDELVVSYKALTKKIVKTLTLEKLNIIVNQKVLLKIDPIYTKMMTITQKLTQVSKQLPVARLKEEAARINQNGERMVQTRDNIQEAAMNGDIPATKKAFAELAKQINEEQMLTKMKQDLGKLNNDIRQTITQLRGS